MQALAWQAETGKNHLDCKDGTLAVPRMTPHQVGHGHEIGLAQGQAGFLGQVKHAGQTRCCSVQRQAEQNLQDSCEYGLCYLWLPACNGLQHLQMAQTVDGSVLQLQLRIKPE